MRLMGGLQAGNFGTKPTQQHYAMLFTQSSIEAVWEERGRKVDNSKAETKCHIAINKLNKNAISIRKNTF